MNRRSRLAPVTLLVAGITMMPGGLPRASSSVTPLVMAPCTLPGVASGSQCGHLEVFEDRDRRSGRTISIHVARLPAESGPSRSDPVFVLVGGPGQGAIASAADYARLLAPLRAHRDLVFVDQRGTGGSNPLPCDLYGESVAGQLGDFMPPAIVFRCRDALAVHASLSLYSTPIAMDDLDDVRQALGYDQIDIESASYGTRAALVYLRAHGSHVRSVVLRSVSPTFVKQPLHFAEDAQAALDSAFAACERDSDCHTSFPSFRQEFATVLRRLDERPARVYGDSASGGSRPTAMLARGPFSEKVRLMLYAPEVTKYLPYMIHRAAAGDFGPFVAVASDMTATIANQVAVGMYLSVTCAEDVAQITPADIATSPRGTFLGDYRVRQQKAACAIWPRAVLPTGYAAPVQSSVPALIISSAIDPVTPPRWGDAVHATLSHSRHVVLRTASHAPSDACVRQMVVRFIESADAGGVDASCADSPKRPPFAHSLE
jgi:pimeloyl-ACP methyl ester carboxylesterase